MFPSFGRSFEWCANCCDGLRCFNARTGGLVMLPTLRTAASCLLLFSARLSANQTVALTLSPVEAHADNTGRLKLLLHAPSNSAPAGLQWTFRLAPGLDIVGIEAGKAVRKAGKTLVCNGARCLVYGLNRTTIPNGPIALLKIKVNPSVAEGSAQFRYQVHDRARTTKPEIQIGDAVAVSLDCKSIPVVSGSPKPVR